MIDTPDYIDAFGTWHYYCDGPAHEEKALVPKNEFYFLMRLSKGRRVRGKEQGEGIRYMYRVKRCRRCRYLMRSGKMWRGRHLGNYKYTQTGKVPLERMQEYLKELEELCGGVRAAAREVGTSHVLYLCWQGRSAWHQKNKPLTGMHKESAMKVIQALRRVRAKARGYELPGEGSITTRRGSFPWEGDSDPGRAELRQGDFSLPGEDPDEEGRAA